MTTGCVVSPRARADLDEIWDYSTEQWGEDRAESDIRDLWHGIQYVAGDPRRGRQCDDIRAGYYRHAVASHVVF